MFIATVIPGWLTEILAFAALILGTYNTFIQIIKARREKDSTKRRQLAWIIAKLKTPMNTKELLEKWNEAITESNEAISSCTPPKQPSASELQLLISELSSEYRIVNKQDKWRSL